MKKLFLLLSLIGLVSINISCVPSPPRKAHPSYGVGKAKWGAHRVGNRMKSTARRARY